MNNTPNPSRRFVLKGGALALASVGALSPWGPAFLRRTLLAAEAGGAAPPRGKVLVCVFQRGAADGLAMVPPHGDKDYYALRKNIALARPAKAAGPDAALDLDGFFGLHPAMAPLLPLYRGKELAIVHACGSPNPTRSHFDAQDFMEAGVLDDKSIGSGWLNRAMVVADKPGREGRAASGRPSPFRAVSMTGAVPRSLHGDLDVLAIPDLRYFGLAGAANGKGDAKAGGGFEDLYAGAVDEVLGGAGKETFEALSMLKKADPARYKPAKGADYPPNNALGRSLMQVAQLVKADLGVRVAFVESGGWDTHANQGGANGLLAGQLVDFARALAAFHKDLGDRMEDVVVLTTTEFGRAARQNGNNGTDHGHGACFFALGGPVDGGKVLGDWPGLAPDRLFESRDLAVTTDYRDVFAEVARKHLGAGSLEGVFPGFAADAKNERGVLKG